MKRTFNLDAIISIKFGADYSFSNQDKVSELYEFLVGGKYKPIHQIKVHRRCKESLDKQLPFFEELGRDMSKFRTLNKFKRYNEQKYKRIFVKQMEKKYGTTHILEPLEDPFAKERDERIRDVKRI